MIESLIISVVLTVAIEVTLSLLIGFKGEKNIETIIWINCNLDKLYNESSCSWNNKSNLYVITEFDS